MTTRILFVCLGNICRSPTAEVVLRDRAALVSNLDIVIDSAGTSDWHSGEPPYGPMQKAARKHGYDLSNLRARQVVAEDFNQFDLILCMDPKNIADVEALRPKGVQTPVRLFMEYAPEHGTDTVPDSYYTRDFDETVRLVKSASDALVKTLSA